MKAYKCDICGEFYCEPEEDDRDYRVLKWNWVQGVLGQNGSYAPLDICPDCYAGLLNWMKMRKVAMTGRGEYVQHLYEQLHDFLEKKEDKDDG